ncbi:MFS transporter [Leptolyngbya sp. AN03gr2]|uniref:MFS transporter n=1 Tax=Leptolyngbya sp. AN03gr2 TaxID=3423364 RepID=UPI003D316464
MDNLRPSFLRDRLTWLTYALAAFFSYLQAAIGPLMLFLRNELQISYTIAGLHFSAFALGLILAGFISVRITQSLGRKGVLWGSAAGMAIAAGLLALSYQVSLTIASTFLMGLLGALLQITIQAIISDWHLTDRAIAFTEMNVAASLSASLVPLLIGSFSQTALGWRSALWVAAIALIFIFWQGQRIAIPNLETIADKTSTNQKLPFSFWLYWTVMFFGVSIEYCLFYWGADFLESVVGLIRSDAASTMSLYVLSGFIGRIVGSRLTRTIKSESLLLSAIAISAIGFPLFWLASIPSLSILGLLIAGFGVANFYPLILSAAISTVPNQSDAATARLSIATGTAVFTAPFLLGWIADQITLRRAFGLVIVLLITIAFISQFANHSNRHR